MKRKVKGIHKETKRFWFSPKPEKDQKKEREKTKPNTITAMPCTKLMFLRDTPTRVLLDLHATSPLLPYQLFFFFFLFISEITLKISTPAFANLCIKCEIKERIVWLLLFFFVIATACFLSLSFNNHFLTPILFLFFIIILSSSAS